MKQMFVEEKVYRERERLFWRSAKRSIKEYENSRISFSYVSGRVRSLSQEEGNQRLRVPHKSRSAKQESKCSGAEERTKDTCSPNNSTSLSSLAAHPTSSPSYSRPVRCCPPQLANWNREPGNAWREESRCQNRQEQVASYSRALVVTAATATTLRAAVLLRRITKYKTQHNNS